MMSSHRLLLLLPLTDRIFYEGEEGGVSSEVCHLH